MGLLVAISVLAGATAGLSIVLAFHIFALREVTKQLSRYVSLLEPEPFPYHLRERPIAARPSRSTVPQAMRDESDRYRDEGIVDDPDTQ